MILPADVLSLEVLCAIEDCLTPRVPVGYLFLLVIAAPEGIAAPQADIYDCDGTQRSYPRAWSRRESAAVLRW